MQRQPPVSHDDIIEDVDDSEMPPLGHPHSRSHAVQPRDLHIEVIDAVTTPQPQHTVADAGSGAKVGSTAAPLEQTRTPAAGYVTTNGATARHALLTRLATTPRSDMTRLKPQQRPQVQRSLRCLFAVCIDYLCEAWKPCICRLPDEGLRLVRTSTACAAGHRRAGETTHRRCADVPTHTSHAVVIPQRV